MSIPACTTEADYHLYAHRDEIPKLKNDKGEEIGNVTLIYGWLVATIDKKATYFDRYSCLIDENNMINLDKCENKKELNEGDNIIPAACNAINENIHFKIVDGMPRDKNFNY